MIRIRPLVLNNNMDMDFLAGNYLYGDIPPDKSYMQHYFKGEAEKAFVSYYYIFPGLYTEGKFKSFYENFSDHTGICCSTRWVRKLLARIAKIEKDFVKASKDFDLDKVSDIKSGKASF